MHHCVIGITFLLASIYSTIYKPNKDIFRKFQNLLNDQQLNIYHSIVQERIKIYTIALVSGLLWLDYIIICIQRDLINGVLF